MSALTHLKSSSRTTILLSWGLARTAASCLSMALTESVRRLARAEKDAADHLARGTRLAAEAQFQQMIMEQRQFSAYQPTINELAGSRTNTPWARQARYIEWLEAGARNQVLWGDVAGAKETVKGVQTLKGQLEDLGLVKPESSMEKMQEHLEVLRRQAEGDGLKVNVKVED